MPSCTHPPARLFSWFAHDGVGRGVHDRTDLCIACCECGEVLAGSGSGAAELHPEPGRRTWRQVTEAEEGQDPISPEDTVFEAKTIDGYILGSACLEGFGPLAYANNPDRLGFDTIAFCGHDDLDIVANGKPRAVKLLQKLIAYERETT